MQTSLCSFDFNVKKRRSCSSADSVCEDSASNETDWVDSWATIAATAANGAKNDAQMLFDKLPIELNQRIAEHIDDDNDVESFRNACTATSDAIDSDNMSFWRRRFLDYFEMPLNVQTNAEFKRIYLTRKDVLKKGAGKDGFEIGNEDQERRCLEMMRGMLLEAFSERNPSNTLTYDCKNLIFIISIAKSNKLFEAIFNPKHQHKREQNKANQHKLRLLQTIQIVLAPCLLSFDIEPIVYRFSESQEMVYSTADAKPFFDRGRIDIELVLHHLNFWRYYMVHPKESILEPVYRALTDSEKPQFWATQLCDDNKCEIGRYWKGAYAFVDREEIEDIRSGEGYLTQFQDEFCGVEDNSEFQDLELQLDINGQDSWSEYFEEHLHSLTPPQPTAATKTRAQKRSACSNEMPNWQPRSFRFGGKGSDHTEDFIADGWLNPLPAQEGIPGWQRMTMMKFYEDPDTKIIDYAALWAYEGIVLPGGQIMIGRWWSPNPGELQMYSGPFLLWCVDGAFEKQSRQESVEL